MSKRRRQGHPAAVATAERAREAKRAERHRHNVVARAVARNPALAALLKKRA